MTQDKETKKNVSLALSFSGMTQLKHDWKHVYSVFIMTPTSESPALRQMQTDFEGS